jgi:hypothetical protein
MYIRIIEKPTEKMESLGNYSEEIQIDVNDLRQVDRKVDEVWQRRVKITKEHATFCIYGEQEKPLVKGEISARDGILTSVQIVPICGACLGDMKTNGQFARRYGTTETEESRRKIHYCCMDEKCKEYGVDHELMAVFPA